MGMGTWNGMETAGLLYYYFLAFRLGGFGYIFLELGFWCDGGGEGVSMFGGWVVKEGRRFGFGLRGERCMSINEWGVILLLTL